MQSFNLSQARGLPPFGWQKRIMIAGHIIEGLRHLHERPQPIIHRDIKSANILLDGGDIAHVSRNILENVTRNTSKLYTQMSINLDW